MRRDPTRGARRELRLALRATRAAITHARWAESVQHLPAKSMPAVASVRLALYDVEEQLCRRLGALG